MSDDQLRYEATISFIRELCKEEEGEWVIWEDDLTAAFLDVFLTTEKLTLLINGLKILAVPIDVTKYYSKITAPVKILVVPSPFEVFINIPGYFDYWTSRYKELP